MQPLEYGVIVVSQLHRRLLVFSACLLDGLHVLFDHVTHSSLEVEDIIVVDLWRHAVV